MTREEREIAARWRHEEQVQLIQLVLHRRVRLFDEMAQRRVEELADLERRYEKLVNQYDELREQMLDACESVWK